MQQLLDVAYILVFLENSLDCRFFETQCNFRTPKIMAKFERDHPLLGRQMQVGWVKIGQFPRKTCYNSKTVQDRRIVSTKVE